MLRIVFDASEAEVALNVLAMNFPRRTIFQACSTSVSSVSDASDSCLAKQLGLSSQDARVGAVGLQGVLRWGFASGLAGCHENCV